MTPQQFIEKRKLTEKDVPRLYDIYLDLMQRDPVQALNLSAIITLLDKKHLLTY
jgi:hypothetical protein